MWAGAVAQIEYGGAATSVGGPDTIHRERDWAQVKPCNKTPWENLWPSIEFYQSDGALLVAVAVPLEDRRPDGLPTL